MPRRRGHPLRQFQCDQCARRWWTRVPNEDPVSECRRCKLENKALPPEKESGWAKFECDCGNNFSGYATLVNPAESPCYDCNRDCTPVEVLRFANFARRPKSNKRHSCTGIHCYNRVKGKPARGDCVHPQSIHRQNQ